MLSDEEILSLNRMKLFARSSDLSVVTAKDMDIVVTLVEKHSKEIEELKDFITKLKDKCKELIFEKQELTSALLDSIPNDKIKAKIEEYKEKCKNCNFKGKICEDFTKNYNCVIAVCLNEFYSLLERVDI